MNKLIVFAFFVLFISVFFVTALDNFNVNPLSVKVVVKVGEKVNVPINIINLDGKGELFISSESSGNFINIDKKIISFESKRDLSFLAELDSLNLAPGAYAGRIFIDDKNEILTIPVVFEIESTEVLFDSFFEIPSAQFNILPGNDLNVDVKIFNLKSKTGRVHVNFIIKDFLGNTILSESQYVEVGNQIQLSKSFYLPENLEYGDYLFYVLTESEGLVATSSSVFSVGEQVNLGPKFNESNQYLYAVMILAGVLIVVFFGFNYFWNKKIKDNASYWNKKVVNIRKIKLGNVAKEIHNLEYKKKLLDSAYSKKYIKKISYDDSRKKINELINQLKKRL